MDWTRPGLREEPEIRSLTLRGSSLLLYLGGKSGQENVLDLWNRVRDTVEKLLSLSEAYAEAAGEDARSRTSPLGRGKVETVAACWGEIERLLATGRVALSREDTASFQRSLSDARVLLAWVPQIDPLLEYQRQFDSLQQKLLAGAKKPSAETRTDTKADTKADTK